MYLLADSYLEASDSPRRDGAPALGDANHFVHHGRAGLRMLGFDPEQAAGQVPFDFVFDDDARARSICALTEELPHRIFSAHRQGQPPPSFMALFDGVCNETPATKELITGALIKLRAEKEIEILTIDGRERPRTASIDDSDVLVPAKQRGLFSTFNDNR